MRFLTVLILFNFPFVLLAQDTVIYSTGLDSITENSVWINQHTRTSDTLFAVNFFSRTDKTQPYGIGLESSIPKQFQGNIFSLKVSAKYRTIGQGTKAKWVITLSQSDSLIYWKGISLLSNTPEWTAFQFEEIFPRNIPVTALVKIYVWNESMDGIADADDLKIEFSDIKFPSFIPQFTE